MAGEHDFAPLSEAELADLSAEWRHARHREWRMAAEIRASRAAMRALVEAMERDWPSFDGFASVETEEAWDDLRALVAHVGREGEGRCQRRRDEIAACQSPPEVPAGTAPACGRDGVTPSGPDAGETRGAP